MMMMMMLTLPESDLTSVKVVHNPFGHGASTPCALSGGCRRARASGSGSEGVNLGHRDLRSNCPNSNWHVEKQQPGGMHIDFTRACTLATLE
eukprot:CAMPEP_0118860360 /NCGR_PEP_ID=MMETSP1163-20130328/6241_1 /TAXON_ID=124430 /ORGANISM="Phaeomonas parva, Strain CCMP2877" /LENGTH=91 /DNA_ID=CAMNT_0006794043 /DNA_START=295 /DNA_END=568 /DNA_ORIENTATION=+